MQFETDQSYKRLSKLTLLTAGFFLIIFSERRFTLIRAVSM
jgi:hypothetical protein